MKKSKTIYLFNIIVFIFLLVYSFNYSYESKYKNESEITGIIVSKKIKENNVTLIIKGREKVQANCYDCVVDYKIGDIVKLKGYFKDYVESFISNSYGYYYPEAKHWVANRDVERNELGIYQDSKISGNIVRNIDSLIEKRNLPIISMMFSTV